MAELADGETTQVIGNSGTYTLSNVGGVYSCSCPAWRHQRLPGPLRTCKHIYRFRGAEPGEEEQLSEEAPALRAEREVALAAALEQSPVLSDRMEEVYGLRLPPDVAYVAGFLKGLTPDERAELERYGAKGLIGVGAWFDEATLTRAPGGDERLRDRLRGDLPEFVPVFLGSEGERWGLWYDDSHELPSGVSGPYAGARTLLDTLHAHVRGRAGRDSAVVRWLYEVVHRESDRRFRDEGGFVVEECPIPLLAGLWRPYVPESVVADPTAFEAPPEARNKAYGERAPIVDKWIEHARAKLRDGDILRALSLARELHRLQAPEYHYACTELFIRAYAALGRGALADIVRVAYRHHEPEVAIYELPPPHPAIAAASSEDADEIARAFREAGPPTSDELDEALAAASSERAIDALLDNGRVPTDAAAFRRLQAMARRDVKPGQTAHHRALFIHLLERGTVSARVLERLLRRRDNELIATAGKRVDLTSTVDGSTPLHLAARAAEADLVRVLLRRGADPRAKNAAGRMAYDAAREAQTEDPLLVGPVEILGMLQAAGAGITRPPPPASDEVEYSEGDAVHHGKLGDGVVESVTGEGGEARLKIRFDNETRVFLAKFVCPRGSRDGHVP